MKKVKLTILGICLLLALAVEFLWSVLFEVIQVIGHKCNELADAAKAAYEKAKS